MYSLQVPLNLPETDSPFSPARLPHLLFWDLKISISATSMLSCLRFEGQQTPGKVRIIYHSAEWINSALCLDGHSGELTSLELAYHKIIENQAAQYRIIANRVQSSSVICDVLAMNSRHFYPTFFPPQTFLDHLLCQGTHAMWLKGQNSKAF